MMNRIIGSLASRKFFLVMSVFITSTWLLTVGKITNSVYMSLSQMLLIAYITGNITQSFVLTKLEADPSIEETSDDILGGRKFILVFIMYYTMLALIWCNYITASMYVDFTQWLVGIYITGNIASKAVENGLNITIGKK